MDNSNYTYRKLYEYACDSLKRANITDYETDAYLLLEYVFDLSKAYYLLKRDEIVDGEARVKEFKELIHKRSLRIPLQHILGICGFMEYDFKVSPAVLIPRQDTETLCFEAIDSCVRNLKENRGCKVLDMCTGSGCIGISIDRYIKDHYPDIDKESELYVWGVDISKDALLIANENKDRLNSDIRFVESNLFENLKEKDFDIIVSNPPYIKTKEIAKLETEVKDYDPFIALDGMEDGLYFYREICKEAPKYLRESGEICFEIGYDQAEDVSSIMKNNGFRNIKVIKDLSGNDRVVTGRL